MVHRRLLNLASACVAVKFRGKCCSWLCRFCYFYFRNQEICVAKTIVDVIIKIKFVTRILPSVAG
jgi:hypothetical protein